MQDNMSYLWHSISEHLHSRHFWVGVGITMLIVTITTLLFLAIKYGPVEYNGTYPYGPYGF